MPTYQSIAHTTANSSNSYTPECNIHPALVIPGSNNIETALCSRALWNHSNWPILILFTLICLLFSMETKPCASTCGLRDMVCPSSWELWKTNSLLNSSHLLIYWPHLHLNNNKTCILKHTPTRMVVTKKSVSTRVDENVEKLEPSCDAGGNVKMMQSLCKIVSQFFQKLNLE